MPFAPGAQRQPMGLLDQGGGVGLLDGIAANRNMLMSLGLGLLSGQGNSDAFEKAMLGATTGSRSDLLAQKEIAARREKLAQQQAYQRLLQQRGLDPTMAADPDLARSVILDSSKTKDPRYVTSGEDIVEIGPGGKARIVHSGRSAIDQALDESGVTDQAERARLKREKFFPSQTTRAPVGYRWTADGNLEAIPGGPAEGGSMTESQANSGMYADRALNAHGIISQHEDINRGVSGAAGAAAAQLPLIGNQVISQDRQKYMQAQRDFVNAVLRKESGAVISESEFENARQQYFPQPGDGPDVIAQKQRAREIEIMGLQRGAGKSYQLREPQGTSAAGAIQPGQTVKRGNVTITRER